MALLITHNTDTQTCTVVFTDEEAAIFSAELSSTDTGEIMVRYDIAKLLQRYQALQRRRDEAAVYRDLEQLPPEDQEKIREDLKKGRPTRPPEEP